MRLLREQDQAGTLPGWPCANTSVYSLRRDTGDGQDLHRPGCGGSTPPSRRERLPTVASIAAMQSRRLSGQSREYHRGDPPDFARRISEGKVAAP
jgi:hypothetical protein